MKINKAYKFRIYPTKKQVEYIEGCFNACRYVYNVSLSCEKQSYELWKMAESYGVMPLIEIKKPSLSAFSLGYHLKYFKIKDEWLKKYDSLALEFEMDNLAKAFESFFKGGGYPKFKSKYDSKQSFRTRQKVSLEKDGIKIPKLKEVIFAKVHRDIEGIIKQMTISKENSKYYVAIMTEIEKEISIISINKEVGLDWGINSFATLSNGEKINSPSFLNKKEKTYLKILQQKLAKAKKGSKNREQIKNQIASAHEKIRRQREYFLHNTSKNLVEKYDRIYIENLSIKNMTASASGTVDKPGKNVKQKSGLNRAILDKSPSKFMNMLGYKTKFAGKELVRVPKFYASSKTCSSCGYKNQELTLNTREWKCEKCDVFHDRDINAAKNIKAEGQRSLTLVK